MSDTDEFGWFCNVKTDYYKLFVVGNSELIDCMEGAQFSSLNKLLKISVWWFMCKPFYY